MESKRLKQNIRSGWQNKVGMFVLLLCVVLLSVNVSAQKQGQAMIDSMLGDLQKTKKDSIKIILLASLSKEYQNTNADAGIKYGTQALTLAEGLHWKKEVAHANNSIGGNYYAKSDYPRAMDYYLKALKINDELGNKQDIAINSVNIGIIYYLQKDSSKALDYYFKALAINEQLRSVAKGDTAKIVKQLAENLADIASVYSDFKRYPKAMEYYQRALQINIELNNKEGEALIFSNIGQDYSWQNNYREALKYYFKSLGIYQELGDKDGISANYGAIGQTYLVDSFVPSEKATNLNNAINYLTKGIAICKETGNLNYIIDFSKDLSSAYTLSGNCAEALQSLKMYVTLTDSVFSDKNKIKIAELGRQREKELNDRLVKFELLKRRNEGIAIVAAFAALLFVITLIFRNNRRVRKEKDRSDELLLNILPAKVAEELKSTGKAEAKYFEEVTVIFTDFVDFTLAAERMSAHNLVAELDLCFQAFDSIVSKYKIEKIKTAGDAYMAVSGLPVPAATHAVDVVSAALEINQFMQDRRKKYGDKTFNIRIGIHSGDVVAGIVGHKKFAYDIWGDTVNTAARMEQNSTPGKINISETTYKLVKDTFECTYRGEIEAKNKGSLKMYFVTEAK